MQNGKWFRSLHYNELLRDAKFDNRVHALNQFISSDRVTLIDCIMISMQLIRLKLYFYQ